MPISARQGAPVLTSVSLIVCTVLAAGLPAAAAAPPDRVGSRAVQAGQLQGVPFKIESWLYAASPAKSGLSSTVKACVKLQGAIFDQGGDPQWTEATYSQPVQDYSTKCGMWVPAGAFIFVPPVGQSTDTTVYAVHTITGRRGQLTISFSGTYDLVKTYQTTSCSWLITGGTGAYVGMMGEGTCTADASHFPYIRHTETGTLYRLPLN